MKEKWKILAQAMIISLIIVCIFNVFSSLPFWNAMMTDTESENISGVGSMITDTSDMMWFIVPFLFFVAMVSSLIFAVLTVILYFAIGYMKKK